MAQSQCFGQMNMEKYQKTSIVDEVLSLEGGFFVSCWLRILSRERQGGLSDCRHFSFAECLCEPLLVVKEITPPHPGAELLPGGNGQHWEGECLKKGMEWGEVYWEEELKIKA